MAELTDPVGVVLAVVAIMVGIWGVWEVRQLFHRFEKEFTDAIYGTLEAIKTNGAETRKTIADVHKSIKEELE